MSKKLKDVVQYTKARISLDEISVKNYVSTDNLLQNKQGKTYAEKMPKQASKSVARFDKGDILIANIRPYLKKIWYAKYTGGSSSDVLTFNLKDKEIDYSSFVYYSLFRDDFFEHMMNGSKGTKMPRGDKQQVLEFEIPNFEYATQKAIAKVLSDLDSKIELNNKINTELEAMAKLIYDYWFVQFDFPDENGKPFKTSGGKMVFNKELNREIPEGWDNGTLDDLGTIIGGSTPSKKEEDNFTDQGVPWITPKDLSMNSGKKFITKGEIDASEKGVKNASLKTLPKGTVLLSSRAPIGYMVIARQDLTTNQGFKSFVPNKGFSTEYIYYSIQGSMKIIEQYASGSTFKEISGSVLKSITTILPPGNVRDEFVNKIQPIFKRQDLLELENQKLAELRDWLLPMLMNGQVKVK